VPIFRLTIRGTEGIIQPGFSSDLVRSGFLEDFVATYIDIALIITSIALILSVILQSKGAGLGGLTGGDAGGIFTARRGIEKVLFRVTIALSVLFFILAITVTLVSG
jgi:preprotein translocase subunit SecG